MDEKRKKPVRKTVKAVSVEKENSSSKKTACSLEQFAKYVQQRAYYLWEEQGQPQEKDMEIWLLAEKDIRKKFSEQ
jgi:hypothetical protein